MIKHAHCMVKHTHCMVKHAHCMVKHKTSTLWTVVRGVGDMVMELRKKVAEERTMSDRTMSDRKISIVLVTKKYVISEICSTNIV